MSDENTISLDARVWVKDADSPSLVGERYRDEGGSLTMVWHVDPKTILGVMWIEAVGRGEGEVSAS